MLRSGRLRHRVTVWRPSQQLGTRGERTGNDTIVLQEVPCGIENLDGRELEQARQTVAVATHRVELYADPQKPITAGDYLVLHDGSVLYIHHVDDVDNLGLEYRFLCAKEPA